MRQNYTRFGTIILIGVIFLFIGTPRLFAQESITVVSPDGGEQLYANTNATITWTVTGTVPYVRIEYSMDDFATPKLVVDNLPNNTGTNTYTWTVPDDISLGAVTKIRVVDTANPSYVYDISNGGFRIRGWFDITTPNLFYRNYTVGRQHPISWTTYGTMPIVKLEYSKDDFAGDIHLIDGAVPNINGNNVYIWTVPNDITPDDRVQVRVSLPGDPVVYDDSIGFKILSDIAVFSPAGGERWVVNEPRLITWTHTGTVPYLTILYSKDNFVADIQTITTTVNTGSYTWTIPDDKNENVKVRVCDARDLTAYGQSPNRFKIDYYYITFNVLDDLTLMHLNALTFRDTISGQTEFPVTSPKIKGYPYGVYNVMFYRSNYAEGSKDFLASADKVFTVKLESSLVHNWNVMADFNYDPVGDDLYVTSWFMRDGLLMTYDPETGARAEIDLYDQTGAFVKKLESTTPDSLGLVFRMTWNNTGLYPGQTYLAKVTIVYQGKAFTSVLTLKIESGVVQSYLVQSYQVTAYLNFNTPANRLETTSWLMLDGLMIPNPDGITISIHDQAGVLTKTLSSFTHDNDGAFRINWDNPGLAPQQTYLAYVTIVYDGKSFNNIIAYSISAGAPTAQETPQTGSSGAVTLTGSSGSNKEYDGISWVPGRCGLMGIEALALIGILLWFKRKC